MPNGFLDATCPILIVDDVASEAMTLDLLCRLLRVETVGAASVAEAGAMLVHTTPAAFIARRGVPFKPPRQGLH